MKYFLKKILSRIARPFGLEVVRYTPEQRGRLRNCRHLSCRDLVGEEALIFISVEKFFGLAVSRVKSTPLGYK